MYSSTKDKSVEDICFDENHVRKVIKEIQNNFEPYFNNFIETSSGTLPSAEEFKKLQEKFGVSSSVKQNTNFTQLYKDIFNKAIEAFEKDRKKYIKLLDEEKLEEYQYDPGQFKAQVLKNECPIIHGTLMNKAAKELDNYRRQFNIADPNKLLEVVTNLTKYGNTYKANYYSPEKYLGIDSYKDLHMEVLDTEDYTAYGVIGGGIKTLMLHKLDPEIFPSRSKNAIWALYYLTNQQSFDCKQDSEFLIIDIKKIITKQNYFYPYELFSKYALELFKLLNNKALELNVNLNPEYRYVIVDAFLDHVAEMHADEIMELSKEFREDGYYFG